MPTFRHYVITHFGFELATAGLFLAIALEWQFRLSAISPVPMALAVSLVPLALGVALSELFRR